MSVFDATHRTIVRKHRLSQQQQPCRTCLHGGCAVGSVELPAADSINSVTTDTPNLPTIHSIDIIATHSANLPTAHLIDIATADVTDLTAARGVKVITADIAGLTAVHKINCNHYD